jgi:glyoxylase-like metal-dependent hydrolase (beta-lactamase superfamily II)
VQQEELTRKQPEFIRNFSQRTPEIKALLQDVIARAPDVVFDREAKLDLGGVTVRLRWFGPAHTRGDNFIFVEEDGVLFTGDAVVNRFFPIFPDPDAGGKSWLTVLDEIDRFKPRTVVPGHGEVGDATLIANQRNYLKAVQSRVAQLKAEGKSADDAAKALDAEFRSKYPNWENPGWIVDAVKRFHTEAETAR